MSGRGNGVFGNFTPRCRLPALSRRRYKVRQAPKASFGEVLPCRVMTGRRLVPHDLKLSLHARLHTLFPAQNIAYNLSIIRVRGILAYPFFERSRATA